MKHFFNYIIGSLIIPFITACSIDERDVSETDVYTLQAIMPEGKQTRTSVILDATSLSLIPRWLPSDEISLFARPVLSGAIPCEIGKTQVSNISDDGNSCEFQFQLPDNFYSQTESNPEGTEVYGLCGKEGVVNEETVCGCCLSADLCRSGTDRSVL